MAIFRLALKYAGRSCDKIVDVDARTPKDARKKCDEMLEADRNELERLSRFNVYKSNMLESCRLCPYNYRLDLASFENLLGSENNI